MNTERFDRLAKELSTGRTRRSVLRVLAGLPLSVLLAGVAAGPEEGLARPKRRPGNGNRNQRHQRNHQRNKGNGKRTINVPGPCQGKDDRDCCGDGQWCQGGACVAIPDDAGATLAECAGRCDCTVASCGIDRPENESICGKTLACPNCRKCDEQPCSNCGAGVPTCSNFTFMNGPAGNAIYCTPSFGSGTCPSGGDGTNADCPVPAEQGCDNLGLCFPVCDGVAP